MLITLTLLCSNTRSVFVYAAIFARLTLIDPYWGGGPWLFGDVVPISSVAADVLGLGGQLEPGDIGSSFTLDSSTSFSGWQLAVTAFELQMFEMRWFEMILFKYLKVVWLVPRLMPWQLLLLVFEVVAALNEVVNVHPLIDVFRRLFAAATLLLSNVLSLLLNFSAVLGTAAGLVGSAVDIVMSKQSSSISASWER